MELDWRNCFGTWVQLYFARGTDDYRRKFDFLNTMAHALLTGNDHGICQQLIMKEH
jgi:hypothetical protein